MQKKKGISLITLVITIIVMIVLSGAAIISIKDTNIMGKSKEAVDKYNESQNEVLELLESTDEDWEELTGKKQEKVIYTESVTGSGDNIELPIALKDTSKQYILEIASSMYTGKVLLNMYNIEGKTVGMFAINSDTSYKLELRHILASANNPGDLTSLYDFDLTNIALITAEADDSKTIFRYEAVDDITIKKVSSVNKTYTKYAKLMANNKLSKTITASEMKKAMQYCINSETLGYDYINELMDNDSSMSEVPRFNEAFEEQTIKNIINTKGQDLKDLEYSVTNQMWMPVMLFLEMSGIYTEDWYTLASYVQENSWMNEYLYRTLGNTIVPFTILFADEILADLNEDGLLNGSYSETSTQLTRLSTGNAGITTRYYADFFAVMKPIMDEYGDSNSMTGMERLKYQEMINYMQIAIQEGNLCSIPAGNWMLAYEVYCATNMDAMYKLMYDNGITINMAGLKIGWNSIISEVYIGGIGLEIPSYDLKEDTDVIQRQGASAILNELYTYVSAAQNEVKSSYE